MRVPIRWKISGLLIGFILILVVMSLKLSYDYFLADKVASVRELQMLQVNQHSNDIGVDFEDLRFELREIAARLLDPTRGSINEDETRWLWVSTRGKSWTATNFKGRPPLSMPDIQKRWGMRMYFDEDCGRCVIISERVEAFRADERVVFDVYGVAALSKAFAGRLAEKGPISTVLTSVDARESVNGKEYSAKIWMGEENATRYFDQILQTMGPKWRERVFGSKQARASTFYSMIGTYLLAWTDIPLKNTHQRLKAISFIDRAAVVRSFQSFLYQQLFYAFLVIGLAGAASVWLASRLSRPIEEIVAATKQLQTGRFDTRVKITQHDEVGDLGEAFNLMGRSLEQREKDLQEAQNALVQNEKLAALGTLSAGIAHEVKNPLAGILGNADLAEAIIEKIEPETASSLRRYIDVIKKETKRTRGIIDGLMRFSRKEKSEKKDIDLELVLWDTIQLMEHSLNMKSVQIGKHFNPNVQLINGNSNSVEQVFLNMLQNAGHAMDEGGRIDIYTERVDSETEGGRGAFLAARHPEFKAPFTRVRIKDNGAGMSQEVLEKIFEPFFTTKEAGKGTGLGLSVTMNILNEHRAQVSIDSSPGQGTCFYLDFMATAQRTDEVRAQLAEMTKRSAGGDAVSTDVVSKGRATKKDTQTSELKFPESKEEVSALFEKPATDSGIQLEEVSQVSTPKPSGQKKGPDFSAQGSAGSGSSGGRKIKRLAGMGNKAGVTKEASLVKKSPAPGAAQKSPVKSSSGSLVKLKPKNPQPTSPEVAESRLKPRRKASGGPEFKIRKPGSGNG